ncbi:transglycosylase family protein [Streptomyces sp. NBC_01264]|uniref:LysM peptidoglycan-binding domain-containing protein n=1 Tax=Streptomyces sp. NBC_01264 TaxID=2903804 RepID=UPI00224CBE2E|nr:transglycosylase family protein [Streptomyces sp. NBC_01264]MCX4781772.1 LysM peptidoglycan-binding domain-containing protein [Streptomyces sp. NBC_01264]
MLGKATGRRRRPNVSRTRRVAAAAGVTGAGIALPLLLGGSAQAATAHAWEQVAQCESGGKYAINTGNGYYGGLQFSSSTWQAFGGHAYAPNAHLATKEQQIAIAEKVLAGQGKDAWGNCSKALRGQRASVTQQPPAQPPAQEPPATQTIPEAAEGTYTVQAGDTLAGIARSHGLPDWEVLHEANLATVPDPNLIRVGQLLHVPGPVRTT